MVSWYSPEVVPTRSAVFLVVVARGAVLLEERPSRGIWGGLWVPPQFETAAALKAAVKAMAPGAKVEALAQRTHGFTHYTLEYVPYVLKATRRVTPAGLDAARWVPLDALSEAPLPAPMRTLLGEIARATSGRRAASGTA